MESLDVIEIVLSQGCDSLAFLGDLSAVLLVSVGCLRKDGVVSFLQTVSYATHRGSSPLRLLLKKF